MGEMYISSYIKEAYKEANVVTKGRYGDGCSNTIIAKECTIR